MNRHPALIVTGPPDGLVYHLLDVPPDLERLVPSGTPGVRMDVPYVNSGVLAAMVDGHEPVELWVPFDPEAALHEAALRARRDATPTENAVLAALTDGEVTFMGPDGSTMHVDWTGPTMDDVNEWVDEAEDELAAGSTRSIVCPCPDPLRAVLPGCPFHGLGT